MTNVTLQMMKIDERAEVPKYAHNGDMCMDLKVIIDDKEMRPFIMTDAVATPETIQDMVRVDKLGEKCYTTIEPEQTITFHTGLKCSTPHGFGMKVYVRSSTGLKRHLRLANGTGIIDTAQYRGELLLGLHNFGSKPCKVFSGERVAQAEIVRTLNVEVVEVTELSETDRGEGGFGSSGRG